MQLSIKNMSRQRVVLKEGKDGVQSVWKVTARPASPHYSYLSQQDNAEDRPPLSQPMRHGKAYNTEKKT
jgi:hypothetical protein